MPALMTPCHEDRTPNFAGLVETGRELIAAGMSAVVYCGSMGDWPLLSDDQRQAGIRQLAEAGVPVIVKRYDGMIHGFYWMLGALDASRTLHADLAEAVVPVLTPVPAA